MHLFLFLLCLSIPICCMPTQVAASSVSDAVATVRQASPTDGTGDDVRQAWKTIAAADASEIPSILRGMNDSNPAVENWLRAAADAIAARTLDAGGLLPADALVELLDDSNASPRARRTAYEWLEEIDRDRAQDLLAQMINDPSLELRYDAIALNIERAERAEADTKKQRYARLLAAARDLDQIKALKADLEELGESIDLASHMGFVTSWRLGGVFDNTNKSGFDVAYPPESEIDFTATYQGKEGDATWRDAPVTTDDELGELDLNDALGAKKGAIVYAYAEVELQQPRSAVVRYASRNATKLWVNGQLAAANEVYHAGGEVDQYTTHVDLVAGTNTLLVKVCQNEQTEPWAQDWSFQLRLTDELGGAIEMKATALE